jgi:hypothetical protein
MIEIIEKSHVDHGLNGEQVEFILSELSSCEGFGIHTVELPAELGSVPCALYGPTMGDDPLSDADTFLQARSGREYPSRIAGHSQRPRPTTKVTVIVGPHEDKPCVLYTAFGGPLAPKEVNDPFMKPEEVDASKAFWSTHALAL